MTQQEAIDRLRSYEPPPTNYGDLPLSRRAAVLILLYADHLGDLKVVLTIRAKTLSSCTSVPSWLESESNYWKLTVTTYIDAGQAALPGGELSWLLADPFPRPHRTHAREERKSI